MSGSDYKLLGSLGSAAPPPGVEPNFTNPYSIEIYSTVILSICLPILTLVLWTRLYTRFHIAKSAGWEDYCALLAWIGVVGYATTGIILFQNGVGSHQWDVTMLEAFQSSKASYASEPIYRLTSVFAKLAILLQLLRIFVPGRQGTISYAIHALIWFNILSHGTFIIVALFQCRPVRQAWNPTVNGKCINIRAVLIGTAVINVFSDFSILLLPLYSIWQLQMPVKRKVGVSAVFCLGLIACIASVIHLVYDVTSLKSKDMTWVGAPIVLSAYVELTTTVLCGCLPSMPQFFHHFVPKFRSAFSMLISRSKSGHRSDATSTPATTNVFVMENPPFQRNFLQLDERVLGKGPRARSSEDEERLWR